MEKDTQRQIIDFLNLKRIFHFRNNSGALKTESGGFVRFGAKGSPDIICVMNGKFIGIEVKAPKGKQSDYQIQFQDELELAGGQYILARSLEDVMNNLPNMV